MDHEPAPHELSGLSWIHDASLSIVILRPGPLSDAQWFEFVVGLQRSSARRLLLFVLGPVQLAPARRRSLIQQLAAHQIAAIVDDMAGRSLVAAMRWAGLEIETFPLAQVRAAVASLGPTADPSRELELAARLVDASALTDRQRAWLAPASRFRVIAVHS